MTITDARRAEIAGLLWTTVTVASITVTGKGRRTRTLPITPALREGLDALGQRKGPVARTPEGGRWKPDGLGKHAARILDPWGVTLHQLRHSFAMELYEETGDLGLVAQALGHASVSTTQVYAAASVSRLSSGVLAASFARAS